MNVETLEQKLVSAGLSEAESRAKAALFEKAALALAALGAKARGPLFRVFVPGRIEFLGKHTDYAGGRSLLAAIERGVCLVASRRADNLCRIIDASNHSKVAFGMTRDLIPAAGHWSNYPMTVARRAARNFPRELEGADIAFASDLPAAAGLSSSTALIVAFFSALASINSFERREEYKGNIRRCEDLAGYLGAVENGQSFGTLEGDKGVGTFGGSEDHTAILCCRAGHLSQYSFCPVRHERTVRLGDDYIFVIGSSGVVAEKTGEARGRYNRMSLSASAIADLWRKATGRSDRTLAEAINSSPDAAELIRQVLMRSRPSQFSTGELLNRFEQFFLESEEIIPAVSEAIGRGEVEKIGEMVDRSQAAAESMLGNQVAETIWLARRARELGAVAASAFGAGFGGSVWAMVEARRASSFRLRWLEGYRERFPVAARSAEFFPARAGPPSMRL